MDDNVMTERRTKNNCPADNFAGVVTLRGRIDDVECNKEKRLRNQIQRWCEGPTSA